MQNGKDVLWDLQNYFDPRYTDMIDLGFRGHGYRCKGSGQWGWNDDSGIVPYIYSQIYGQPCKHCSLSYNGQLPVSVRRIHGIDNAVYKEAHHDPRSWACHPVL